MNARARPRPVDELSETKTRLGPFGIANPMTAFASAQPICWL